MGHTGLAGSGEAQGVCAQASGLEWIALNCFLQCPQGETMGAGVRVAWVGILEPEAAGTPKNCDFGDSLGWGSRLTLF